MNAIWAIAARHRLAVIEDAAHAIGAHYHGRPIGAAPLDDEPASDAVAFSFYATKNLTTGEGGMLTTCRTDVMETVRTLALHGTTHDAWDRYTGHGSWHYEVVAHGYKYNLSDIQAAIGIHQLHKLEGFIETRAQYTDIYQSLLSDLDTVELPISYPESRHAWHLYILRLNVDRLKIDRDEFMRELRQRGIGTSVHFIPIPLHPFFAGLPLSADPCRRALELFPRIVSLPLYPAMTVDQVQYVAESVRAVLERAHRVRFVAPAAHSAAPLLASDVPSVSEGSI
jgi:dTDP-4-amino-4,6-dideoxygalactose transaminase